MDKSIASGGNAIDWGDSTDSASQLGGCSKFHSWSLQVYQHPGDAGSLTYFSKFHYHHKETQLILES